MQGSQGIPGSLGEIVARVTQGEVVVNRTPAVAPGSMSLDWAAGSFLVSKSSQGRANSTIILYGKRLGQFVDFCRGIGCTSMGEVDADLIEAFMAVLREGKTLGKHDAGGLSQYYRVVSAFVRWFWKRHKLGPSPIEQTKPPPASTRQLPPVDVETVRALIKAADVVGSHTARVRNRAVLHVLFDCGLRSGELTGLDAADWIEAQSALSIRRGKTPGSTRLVFLGKKSGEALRHWMRVRPNATPLFCTPSGERLTYGGLRSIVRRLAVLANVPTVPLHSFRRGYATAALNSGQDIVTLSRSMGHSTVTMTQRYITTAAADLKKAHDQHAPGDKLG